ncbi:hypothetical protein GGS20DRAFT_582264 [Poronia punctata]|nr:hypothetical protein GGS20DRAFT_582264 [Poronia punctata]
MSEVPYQNMPTQADARTTMSDTPDQIPPRGAKGKGKEKEIENEKITVDDVYLPNWVQYFSKDNKLLENVNLSAECIICGSKLAITSQVDPEGDSESFTVLPCGHVFGYDCITRWFMTSPRASNCPTCRKDIYHDFCRHVKAPIRCLNGGVDFNVHKLAEQVAKLARHEALGLPVNCRHPRVWPWNSTGPQGARPSAPSNDYRPQGARPPAAGRPVLPLPQGYLNPRGPSASSTAVTHAAFAAMERDMAEQRRHRQRLMMHMRSERLYALLAAHQAIASTRAPGPPPTHTHLPFSSPLDEDVNQLIRFGEGTQYVGPDNIVRDLETGRRVPAGANDQPLNPHPVLSLPRPTDTPGVYIVDDDTYLGVDGPDPAWWEEPHSPLSNRRSNAYPELPLQRPGTLADANVGRAEEADSDPLWIGAPIPLMPGDPGFQG